MNKYNLRKVDREAEEYFELKDRVRTRQLI